jgi:predicted NBD/HSP70 family sugar kinase
MIKADQRGLDPGEVLSAVAALADRATQVATAEGLTVAGATLAVPGLVSDGVIRLAPHLGWRDVDARAALPGRRGAVDNEANLAAVGELHAWAAAGEAQDRASFLYVSGEIGIGSGIVLDGQLFRGARGFGGELGHVTIRPDGPHCLCGSRGCLEAYADQESLLRIAGEPSVTRLRPWPAPARADGAGEPGAALMSPPPTW